LIVVVRPERGLTMSYKIKSAHGESLCHAAA
jgi:hypothetical protein